MCVVRRIFNYTDRFFGNIYIGVIGIEQSIERIWRMTSQNTTRP